MGLFWRTDEGLNSYGPLCLTKGDTLLDEQGLADDHNVDRLGFLSLTSSERCTVRGWEFMGNNIDQACVK